VSPRCAKIYYAILLGLASILAIILRFDSPQMSYLGGLTVSCIDGTNDTIVVPNSLQIFCVGGGAVYRISFVMTCFFSLMLVLSLISERFHRGFWSIKVLLVVGGIIGSFFMTDAQFNDNSYAWVARIGSWGFLVLQILVLIDFAYTWNDAWVDRAFADPTNVNEMTSNGWLTAVLVSAALLYMAAAAGIVLLYVYYASCTMGQAFTTICLISILVMTVISLFRDKIVGEAGAILPVALVSIYVTFLCWSALDSNPDSNCVPGTTHTVLGIILGASFATLTLIWTTFALSRNAGKLLSGKELDQPSYTGAAVDVEGEAAPPTGDPARSKRNGKLPKGGPLYREDLNQTANATGAVTDEEDDTPLVSADHPWVFHAFMICASLYVAMLLTDWGDYSATGANTSNGLATLWVKIAADWLTIILFTWTLIAPRVLSGRDFS